MGIVTDKLLDRAAVLISPDLTHIAIGNGTPVTELSLTLNAEVARKAVTDFIDGNVVIKETFFDTTEQNGVNIKTIGLFGQGATTAPNSGVLMFGDNVDIIKTDLESLTLSCEITISRG